MDNAYQAILVIYCPSCNEMIWLEMPTQEVYDRDERETTCPNCGQPISVTVRLEVRAAPEKPPF